MFGSSLNNPYVVEEYDNGSNWYKVYSNGWIEQGGLYNNTTESFKTINFLKPFKSNKYYMQRTNVTNTTVEGTGRVCSVYNLTSTSFQLYNANGFWPVFWYACGQGA